MRIADDYAAMNLFDFSGVRAHASPSYLFVSPILLIFLFHFVSFNQSVEFSLCPVLLLSVRGVGTFQSTFIQPNLLEGSFLVGRATLFRETIHLV